MCRHFGVQLVMVSISWSQDCTNLQHLLTWQKETNCRQNFKLTKESHEVKLRWVLPNSTKLDASIKRHRITTTFHLHPLTTTSDSNYFRILTQKLTRLKRLRSTVYRELRAWAPYTRVHSLKIVLTFSLRTAFQ